jgi:polyribonucleotide nucleotidyltransferase
VLIINPLIDRSIRPLFPEGYSYDTQVICNLLAIDRCTDPDVLCINGASASLAISDIPWSGPVAAVRVVIDKDGRFIIDPTREELTLCQFNLLMTCTEHSIVMVEGYGRETSDEILCQAILYGYEQVELLFSYKEEVGNTSHYSFP